MILTPLNIWKWPIFSLKDTLTWPELEAFAEKYSLNVYSDKLYEDFTVLCDEKIYLKTFSDKEDRWVEFFYKIEREKLVKSKKKKKSLFCVVYSCVKCYL